MLVEVWGEWQGPPRPTGSEAVLKWREEAQEVERYV